MLSAAMRLLLILLVVRMQLGCISGKAPSHKYSKGQRPITCANASNSGLRQCNKRVGILTFVTDQQKPEQGFSRCPCPKSSSKGGLGSLSYEPTYQAQTLEEALMNFKDLSLPDTHTAKPILPEMVQKHRNPTDQDLYCITDSCRICAQFVLRGLRKQLRDYPTSAVMEETIEELDYIMDNTNKGGVGDCKKYSQQQKCEDFHCQKAFQRRFDSNDEVKLRNHLKRLDEGSGEVFMTTETPSSRDPLASKLDPSHPESIPILTSGCTEKLGCSTRRKRESPAEESPFEAFAIIKCTKRGSLIEASSTWCGLCDTCWQLGILRESFMPRFVNLLSCDRDSRCLSGHGECRSRNTTLTNIVKNSGTEDNPKWQPYSITVPIMCDCQLKENSPLMPLASTP